MTHKIPQNKANKGIYTLSEIDETILMFLAKYKFLTISQLTKLIQKHPQTIRNHLALLREVRITNKTEFGHIPTMGRLEAFHFLTAKGSRLLINEIGLQESQVKYPKSTNSIFRNDYFHRISTINTQIAFDLWAESNNFNNIIFDAYFHKIGRQRNSHKSDYLHSITRITLSDGEHIDPDAIIKLESHNKPYLFWLEVNNGHNTKWIIEKLRKVRKAIIEQTPQKKYDHKGSCFVLFTFEHQSNMEAVLDRMKNDQELMQLLNVCFFKLDKETWDSFGENWTNAKGDKMKLSL